MRLQTLSLIILCLVSEVSALDPQAIDDALDQTVVRQEQVLAAQLASPFPSSGLWRHEDYALAAYWLNQQTATADAELIALPTNGLYTDVIAGGNFHWHAYLQERIYFLFSAQSDFFPGRMSTNAENAVLEMLWDWAAPDCKIGMADPDQIQWYFGSENHHLQAWVSLWGAAHIFADHPYYQTLTYADGSTPAEMAAAFDAYFKAFVRERSSKGLLVEVASPTYAKYSLNTWYNLADFASDPELKAAAGALLDIYWADWAMEQIDGVRGGSRHRSYAGVASIESGGGSAASAWYHFGKGKEANKHPGVMCAATTLWRPSRAVVGLALDTAGRGSYGYASRRLGLQDQTPPAPPPAFPPHSYIPFDRDGGSLLRYTWCTPDFVMGMSQMEVLPSSAWTPVSSQNRWNGVIFGGHDTARIFTQRPKRASGSVYNAEWGVQNKGAMILQRLSTHAYATGQMVWFDFSLNRSEDQGWIFGESTNAYAAVKIVDGGWTWEPDSLDQHKDGGNTNVGEWAVLSDQYSPIILETGRKQDYGSMAAFQAEILANPLVWDGTRLDYSSTGYDTTLTLFADESAPPQVDGTPIDFTPEKNYDAPYLQGDFAGGPVIINYGDDRIIHGVAPFADDANTIDHWDFETTVPTVHADSTNHIYEIADGKFGAAFRCDFQVGDQYMMTSSAWPVDKGTFRYQGWIRLNSGDAGGDLLHVYDQVYLSVNTSTVTFKINKSGVPADTSATNVVDLSADISTSNDWQYIEAVYDGTTIKLVTELETVSTPGIGEFVPNVRNIYIGSRKNTSNFVGDMDEVKISTQIDPLAGNSDRDGVTIFAADFQGAVDQGAGNVTLTNLNNGTQTGSWSGTTDTSLVGTDPTPGTNRGALIEQDGVDLTATFSAAGVLADGVTVSYDATGRRLIGLANGRNAVMRGIAGDGTVLFALGIQGSSSGTSLLSYATDFTPDTDGTNNPTTTTIGATGLFTQGNDTYNDAIMETIRLELTTNSFDVYINNVLATNGDDIPYFIGGTAAGDIDRLNFQSDHNGGAWYDNFDVQQIPEPVTVTYGDYISDPTFGLDPAEQGFDLDPDNDGLANGLEAWLGTHPGEFNVGLTGLTTDATTFTFTHPQNENPPSDLSGFYEWSPNLIDWFTSGSGPAGGPVVTFIPVGNGATTTVTVTSIESIERLFFHVGVLED